MATIKINDTQFEATLAQSGERLTLTVHTALPLDELAALFALGTAPEVRVLDNDGLTAAIYSNRKIIEVAVRIDGAERRAVVSLQVEPIEQSVAERLQEHLDAQEQTIAAQQATINRQAQTVTAQQTTIDQQAQTIAAQQAQIDEVQIALDALIDPIPATNNEEVPANEQA